MSNSNSLTFYWILLILSLGSCRLPAQTNNNITHTAYIRKLNDGDSIIIKLFQERKYMVHDPTSIFESDKFYIDSTILKAHSEKGFIKFENIQTIPNRGYPFVRGGIELLSDSLKI